MAAQESGEVRMVPTLGLTGVTINAMALIAPGAFLWITFSSQSAFGGTSMWFAVFIAVFISLMTAISYASLANRYPEAGSGSAYYYAEVAFLHKEEHRHFRFARLSKFIVGWASHLYYWIYPGVMVAFMGILITYILQQSFLPNFGIAGTLVGNLQIIAVCVVFAFITGFIAYIGITSSTLAAVIINVLQIIALIVFSIIAIAFRISHPGGVVIGGVTYHYLQTSALAVLTPKDFNGVLFQATVAILLIVGFESNTALAAEARNPKRDIPRGIILSLIIQAVIFYLFEYFAANFVIGDYYHAPNPAGKGPDLVGFNAAANSGAPIGDIAKYIGNIVFNGNGTAFALILAASVLIALVGTALACLNTGVRVSYTMGKDNELPLIFGFLHGRFRTPHMAIIILTVLSAIVGAYGVLNADNLIQIILISNIGTFLLYGMACVTCMIAFAGVADRNWLTTFVAPLLGAILNVAMLAGVLYFAIAGITGNTQRDTFIAAGFAIVFLVLGFVFLFGRQIFTGVRILHPEDYKSKLAGGPEVSVEAGGE